MTFFPQKSKRFFFVFKLLWVKNPEQLKKLSGTLSKVDLNFDNFELWMTVMSAVESADQI